MEQAIKDKTKQNIGYLTFCLGIILILGTVYFSWKIFSGKVVPPEVFKEGVIQNTNKEITPTQDINELQKQAVNKVSSDIKNTFNDYLPKTLNLFSWSIFAWIVINAGWKLSSLGKDMI
jgi:hypothetical protein